MLALGVAGALALGGTAGAAGLRRVAVVVAHQDGGSDTQALQYAARDAGKLLDVLEDLGGFRREDARVLVGPTADQVAGALAEAEGRVRQAAAAGERTLLLFYYSGHAVAGELRLGRTRLAMKDLRDHLGRSTADIRLAFLDACQSGSITRLKGGHRAPSFVVDVEPTAESRGHVIITSSSEDEASQESDDLRGSFFTHYLVSGLRGAADTSGDSQVTLSEAYGYAYHRTVEHTAGTRGGTQHPTYTYDLQGNGTVVLTRLGGLGAIEFPAGGAGTYLVYDLGRDVVVGEVVKDAPDRRRLSVPPGSYAIKKRATDHLLLQEVRIEGAGHHVVDEAAFRRAAFEDDVTKGPIWLRDAQLVRPGVALRALAGFESFFDGAARSGLFHPSALVGARLDGINLIAPRVSLHADAVVGGRSAAVVAGPYGESYPVEFRMAAAGVGLSYAWWLLGGRLTAGPRLTALYTRRDFVDEPLPFQDLFTFCPGAEVGMGWRMGSLLVGLDARAHYLRYTTEAEDRSLGFGEGYVSLGYAP